MLQHEKGCAILHQKGARGGIKKKKKIKNEYKYWHGCIIMTTDQRKCAGLQY